MIQNRNAVQHPSNRRTPGGMNQGTERALPVPAVLKRRPIQPLSGQDSRCNKTPRTGDHEN